MKSCAVAAPPERAHRESEHKTSQYEMAAMVSVDDDPQHGVRVCDVGAANCLHLRGLSEGE
jgi:hypothetical protein